MAPLIAAVFPVLVGGAVFAAGLVKLVQHKHASDKGSPLTYRDVAMLLFRLVKFRLTWGRHDSHCNPAVGCKDAATKAAVKVNAKFMTPAECVAKIPKGAVVLSCGFGGNEVCTAFYYAVREAFDAKRKADPAHRMDLTWVTVNAQGARSKAPGSVEEVAAPGLVRRYIAGHLETARAFLKVGKQRAIDLYNLPLGTLALLVEAQAKGVYEVQGRVGVGTFIDPRVGDAGRVNGGPDLGFVKVADDLDGEALTFSIPKITVCLLNARFADTDGNLYFNENVTVTESIDGPTAARRHGGVVLASVQHIFSLTPDDIAAFPKTFRLPAAMVDGICVSNNPRMMDPLKFQEYCQAQDMRVLRPDGTIGRVARVAKATDADYAWFGLRAVNRLLRIAPVRTPAHLILARLAAREYAAAFDDVAAPFEGHNIGTIGTGLPEEVSHYLYTHGVATKPGKQGKVTLCTESGAFGGLPAMGVFFGASIAPLRIMTEAEMARLLSNHLQATCLGALQVDVKGNVNVSSWDPTDVERFVGVGGFQNFVDAARHIVFLFQWTTKAKLTSRPDGSVKLAPHGKCKFVEAVDQVTFSGATARANRQRVTYCTHVGLFRLGASGVELEAVFAGIDVQKDVLDVAKVSVKVAKDLKRIDAAIVTGHDFRLS